MSWICSGLKLVLMVACCFWMTGAKRSMTVVMVSYSKNGSWFSWAESPDSSFEMMSISSMRRPILSLCFRMVVRILREVAGESTTSSSMRFSRYPLMMARGVRSSWEAFATNSRFTWSVRCSAVMFLRMMRWRGSSSLGSLEGSGA